MNGALDMINLFRPAVVLALGLLVAACGGGGPSLPGSSPAPLPLPPGDLFIELTPLGEVSLRWERSPVETDASQARRAPVTGYAVYLESPDGQPPRRLAVTGATSYLFTRVVPGRTYVFHVRAVSDVGLSQASESEGVTITVVELQPPAAPGSLSAELTPSNEALLRWTAPPPVPGRAPVTGYAVYRELANGRAELLGRSDSFSYIHPDLTPDTRYVFHVRAMSISGLSQPSASVSLDVLQDQPPFPEAPGSFTAEITVNNEALLRWTAPPPSPDRSPVTGYEVYRELPDGTARKLTTTPADSLSYVHRGLVAGIRYVFHVRSSSAVGLSPPSVSASVELTEGLPPFPEAPGLFTAEITVNRTALLRWTAPPPSPDRSAVTGYEVYRELPDGTARRLATTAVDSLSYVFADVEPGIRYIFHVRALSAIGPSSPSASASVELAEGLPPFPEAPENFTAVLTLGNDAFLSWTAPPPSPDRSPVTGYEVYRELPDGTARRLATTAVDSLSYVFADVLPGVRYEFHVRALSAAGRSPPSASASVELAEGLPPFPEAPGNFTAVLTLGNDAFLSWTAPPPSPDRSAVTGYEVYRELPDGTARRLATTAVDSLSYVFADVEPGARYIFHVRALSAAGRSLPSASASVEVVAGLPPFPEVPGNFTASLVVDAGTPGSQALLQWTAPTPAPDRSPVTGYEVFLEGQARPLGTTTSLSYVHSGLRPGRRYVFYVRAQSAAGPSLPSTSAFVDVPSVLDQVPVPPGNFTVERTPNNDALLRWSAPAPSADRAPVVRFEVFLETSGGGRTPIGTSRSLSFIYANLDWGRRYVFHVEAESAIGPSRPSRSEFIDVPPRPEALPVAPGNFTATLTPDNDVQFEWTAPAFDPNRAPVTGYLVYEVTRNGGVEILNPDDNPVNALTYLHDPDPALVPEQLYTYYVRATSAAGPSLPSVSASVQVPPAPLVPLSIPHVTVRADQSGSSFKEVTVSWIHNLLPSLQSLVTGFEIQYCVVPATHTSDHCRANDWKTVTDTDPTKIPAFGPRDRTYTDNVTCDADETDMTVDQSQARMYRVRALASNPSLSSRYSVPTRPVCPGAGYSPPRRVDSVFAVPVDEMGDRIPEPMAVNICWNVPEVNRSPLLGYELQQTTGPDLPVSEDGWIIVDAHIATGYTANSDGLDDDTYEDPACRLLSSLVANNEYWFRVRAYNLAGHGHWSAPYHYRHGREFVPELTRASVQRPSVLSVSDARASERTDPTLAFEVTLDRPASKPVTVDYATADGTATAGNDYRSASGTLELAAGETSKTIAVAVHADTENEGEETLTLRLSNPAGARIADGEATGTILDRDPLPKEWLARFGRTVAAQAVDAVGTRLVSKPRTHARVGGVSLESSASPDSLETLSRRWADPARNPWDGPEEARGLSRHALMSASSFHLASEGDGPVWAAWGRFAAEGFEADVHDTRLDGDTTTGFLGADVAGGRWLMGAAVSHSEADGAMVPGSGSASARERSDVESTLTGVYPYARMTLSERVSLWGLAGVGQGTLTVSERGRAPAETDIGMNMGALGARGTMLTPSEAGGIELALRSDAFWVRMTSDEARTAAAGDLADIRTDASRVRLFLEAEREFEVRGEGTLTPSLEVGVRHDGGDAETGTGFEAGAGMRYAAGGHRHRGRGAQARRPRGQRLPGVGRRRLGAHRPGRVRAGALADPRPDLRRGAERRGAAVVARRRAESCGRRGDRRGQSSGSRGRLRLVAADRRSRDAHAVHRPLVLRPGHAGVAPRRTTDDDPRHLLRARGGPPRAPRRHLRPVRGPARPPALVAGRGPRVGGVGARGCGERDRNRQSYGTRSLTAANATPTAAGTATPNAAITPTRNQTLTFWISSRVATCSICASILASRSRMSPPLDPPPFAVTWVPETACKCRPDV